MDIKNVTVIGAGTMGNGIAHVFGVSGFSVSLIDTQQAFLDRALATIEKNLSRQVAKEKITQEEADGCLKRIQPTLDLDSAKDSELVVEAATENPDIKKELFAKLDEICPAETVLASNTSSISITEIAAATERAKREAEQKYQAEIAGLRKAAEANRKSAPQTSATASQYKAEIERLRREAADRQKAELERLKRGAEIVRLKRETEASRQRELAARESATKKKEDKRVEHALWTVARGSRSIDDTQAYLDRYPEGRYAAEAGARLSVLEKFAAIEGINRPVSVDIAVARRWEVVFHVLPLGLG